MPGKRSDFMPGFSCPRSPNGQFSFDVDQEVLETHPGEYLEAVMASVVDFVQFGEKPTPVVGLVNRRGIVTIVPREGGRDQRRGLRLLDC